MHVRALNSEASVLYYRTVNISIWDTVGPQ